MSEALDEASDEVILNRSLDDEKLVGDLYTRVVERVAGLDLGGAKTNPFIVTTSLRGGPHRAVGHRWTGGRVAGARSIGPRRADAVRRGLAERAM